MLESPVMIGAPGAVPSPETARPSLAPAERAGCRRVLSHRPARGGLGAFGEAIAPTAGRPESDAEDAEPAIRRLPTMTHFQDVVRCYL